MKHRQSTENMKTQRSESIKDFLQTIKSSRSPNFQKLKKIYSNQQLKSCYGTFFGRKPDLTDYKDMNILKYRKFSQLQCTQMLNPAVVAHLDQWQTTREHPDYLGK